MKKNASVKMDTVVLNEVINSMICADCGRLIEPEEESYTTHDGRVICDDCISDYFFCDDCEEWYNYDELVNVYDSYGDIVRTVCDSCSSWYPRCEECGRVFIDEDYFRGGRCEECAGDLIVPYHAKNPIGLEFHGDINYMSYIQGYIGWELELFGDAYEIAENIHDVTGFEHCHFEEDCSVDVEVIGQPRTLENIHENRALFKAMFDAINSSYTNNRDGAGLHVHVSRTAFGNNSNERADRIAKCMCLFTGTAFEKMAHIAGRSSNEISDWCRCMTANKDDLKSIAKTQGNRYDAINVNNSDTVEFRLGKSTTDYDTFMSWLELIAYIVRKSESIIIDEANNFDVWFYDAPDHIKEMITNTGIELNEPAKKMTVLELNQIVLALARKIDRLNHTNRNIIEALNGTANTLPTINDILTSVGLSKGEIKGLYN